MQVKVDGEPLVAGPVFNVAIANGRYFGGGMMIAPDADCGDGMLDVVSLGDLKRIEALALSWRIYKGSHMVVPKVTAMRGKVVEAQGLDGSGEVVLDVDGETAGTLPIHIRIAEGG